jgi:polysaccharide biosynthesis protein PslG
MRHNPIARLLAPLLAAASLLLALAVFALADNAANRGITYTPGRVPIPWTDVPSLGVNAFNIQYEVEPAKVTRTLELARDLEARFIRMQMPWADVEISAQGDFQDHKNGKSAWEKYDFIIGEMARLGLEPIVRLDTPPDWARTRALATPEFQARKAVNGNATGPPDDYADYADFVGTVAARYRGQARFFQIWNEPNLTDEWNGQPPAPADFVRLLRGAHASAKAANPDAVILFPSLSPTDGLDRTAPISELDYLDQVYAAGGAPFFEIMSAQAYGLGQPPDEHIYVRRGKSLLRPIDTRVDVSRVVLLREVMLRNGDDKAIWISEFGYNSAPAEQPGADPGAWAEKRLLWGEPVSEQVKGEYIVDQIERARREWPWIGVMNIWFLRWGGPPPNPNDPTPYFALIDEQFNPLPGYTEIKRFIDEGTAAGVGAHAWSHPAVAARSENEWAVRFEGSSLALSQLVGPVEVSVDGGAPTPSNPDVHGAAITVASGLADTRHTAIVRSENGAPGVFIVSRAAPLAWAWAVVPALLIAGLVVAGALAMRTLVDRIAGRR